MQSLSSQIQCRVASLCDQSLCLCIHKVGWSGATSSAAGEEDFSWSCAGILQVGTGVALSLSGSDIWRAGHMS